MFIRHIMITIKCEYTNKDLEELLLEFKELNGKDFDEVYQPLFLDDVDSGYLISNYGNIKGKKGTILTKFYLNNYAYTALRSPNTSKVERYRISRLVAFTFCPIRKGLTLNDHVHHIDKNPRNNKYTNLIIVTPEEHEYIHVINGDRKGEKNNSSIYTNFQIKYVCELLQEGCWTPSEIHDKTGVSKWMISLIRKKKVWTHISSKYDIAPLFTHPSKETIIKICELLEKGYSTREISIETGVKEKSISDIRTGHRHSDISSKYKIKPLRKFNDLTKIHQVCKLLSETNKTYKEISKITGINTDTICRIKIGRIHKKISSQYELLKK